ncbi:hypothetical protein DLAC_04029 [Tieghemostelium lacteum]|uniref:Paramecium surface antigen repeat-containing protein n=1 Tax=Tieghemostelium lacteum TaxID=361077 RepID=A0A151ZS19_TIELA|nr:hypothetical protein DLAC_04029 [Tieghemostelium lacteum]|eukprot:KYQ96732.1 hypothetical protein DLAC_04029 [Tieghemostelium lacteum]
MSPGSFTCQPKKNEGARCSSDNECKTSLMCVSGLCQELYYLGYGESSSKSTYCSPPLTLQSGKCLPVNSASCNSDIECPFNHYCSSTNSQCTPYANVADECFEDKLCAIGLSCLDNACSEDYTVPLNSNCYNQNSNCNATLYCESSSNTCKTATPTPGSNNCVSGNKCQDFEVCDCSTTKCRSTQSFSSECQSLLIALDKCLVDNKCTSVANQFGSQSCLMKDCGKLKCQYMSKCQFGSCGQSYSPFVCSGYLQPDTPTPTATTPSPTTPPNNSDSDVSSVDTLHSISNLLLLYLVILQFVLFV